MIAGYCSLVHVIVAGELAGCKGQVPRAHEPANQMERVDPVRSRPPESIPDDIMRGAADGHDVGRAVAVDVAAAEVLRGDVAIEDGPGPGLPGSIELVHRHPMILAAVAGEDLVVAVPIDVGDPERMAVGQACCRSRSAGRTGTSWYRRTLLGGVLGEVDDDLAAVPGLDRREEAAAVSRPRCTSLEPRFGALPGAPGVSDSGPRDLPRNRSTPSFEAVRMSESPSPSASITSMAWITRRVPTTLPVHVLCSGSSRVENTWSRAGSA